jgi:tetratricopeptide (TPR) repeat protein
VKRRILACALACLALAPRPGGAQATSRDWKQLKTPNLLVVGNATSGDLRRVAEELERFRLAIGGFAPSMKLDPPMPTTVVVFHDDRGLTPFKPRARGRPLDNVAAYFAALPEQQRIVLSATGNREFSYQIIFHEYTHLLVNQNVRRLPIWLNEGLAEFYSTFAGSEQDGRTIIGRPIERSVAALGVLSPLPLAKLTASAAAADLRDGVSTARFYATAWALTHYLMVGEGGAMRPQLLALVREYETGQDAGTAFKKVFGDNLAPLDKKVEAHVMQMRLPAIQLPAPVLNIPLEAEPMLEVDAQQIRGDLLVRMGAFDQAAPYIARALEIDKMHVGARLTRARGLLGQDKAPDALDILSAPDLEASGAFDVVLLRAEALRETARYADAIPAYERAVRAQPDAAGAHYGLSLALLAAERPAAAAAFSRCLALRPGAAWYYARQLDALAMGIDTYAISDAVNFVRLQGWQDDSSSYAMLAAAITQRRRGKTADAVATLKEIASHRKADDWLMQLVAFLEGRLTGDALIGKAKGDGQVTEARAYVGILANIAGDRETAKRHLEWVKTSGRRDFTEYRLALGELKRMAKAAAPAEPPR